MVTTHLRYFDILDKKTRHITHNHTSYMSCYYKTILLNFYSNYFPISISYPNCQGLVPNIPLKFCHLKNIYNFLK